MANKIFVSYKYSDSKVLALPGNDETTARHYVDEIQALITEEDHIFKGEDDGQSLEDLADSTIASILGDKIFDSTITIVLVSKGMKESSHEREQWMPWEISYSLRIQSRAEKTSKTNGVLAVILPDENGSYDYFKTYNQACKSWTINTDFLFPIMAKNMFNKKDQETDVTECNGTKLHSNRPHYIHHVNWEKFIGDVNGQIKISDEIRQNQNTYDITKNIN